MILIPAHAGVILTDVLRCCTYHTYPRACGGDPYRVDEFELHPILSPRMRG